MANKTSFGHALKWAYLMNWGERGIGAVVTFLLAAILGPKDFGTVAIAMIYILFIQMLLDQGLVAALIQRKDLRPAHVDSVFWLVLSASLALVAASFGLSRWWAAANHLPLLVVIISALSICIPLEGLTVVQQALLQREMNFRSLSVRANVSVCVGGAVGIGMALTGFGIWALVGQQISRDIVALALLWKLSHWRPRWHFSLDSLKELFGFSASNFAAKLGVFANAQADSLLLGLFFGPVAVGLYRFAERIMNTILTMATSSLQTVSFPEFSRLQDRPAELRRSLLSCIRLSAIVTFPAMAGLAATSNLLMGALGPKWADAADALKLLCAAGLLMSLGQFFGPALQAVGKPHYLAALTWLQTVVGCGAAVLVALHLRQAPVWQQTMGIAAIRLTMSILVGIPLLLFVLPRLCPVSRRDILATVAPSLAAAGVVFSAVTGLSALGLTHRWGPMVGLLLVVPFGAATGGITLYSLDEVLRTIMKNKVFGPFGLWRSRHSSPELASVQDERELSKVSLDAE